MKTWETNNLRNVAIVGHSGCGKTTLTSATLFTAGAINRLGTVEEGNTVTDFDDDEKRRKTTLSTGVAFCSWKDHKINLLDTPGYSDFLTDTKMAMSVADCVLLVMDGVAGVEVQTEKLWKIAEAQHLPRMLLINRLDRERSSFERSLESAKARFKRPLLPLCMPLGSESQFKGVINVLEMKAYVYTKDKSGKFSVEDVPADLKDEAAKYREALIECIAEVDDAVLERYLEGGELTQAEIAEGLRRGIAECRFIPVFSSSSSYNIGLAQLLDGLVTAAPSPLDRSGMKGINAKTNQEEGRHYKTTEPLATFVFKTISDQFGKMTFFKVISGVMHSDGTVYNPNRGEKERIGQIFNMMGKEQHAVTEVRAGDIGAVSKLKHTLTGDTLCDEAKPFQFPAPTYAFPPISFAIEPKAKGDEDKLGSSLHRLMEEDPTLHFSRDPLTKQFLIAGMGQTHIEVAVERMKRRFATDVVLKAPKIPYKETIRSAAMHVQGRYKRQTGGKGQFGDCFIHATPLERTKGFEFVDKIVGGSIPRQFIPAVEKGIREAMEKGIVTHYPMTDVRVELVDGSYHAVDSSAMAFEIAGSYAIKKAVQSAGHVLLEPVMNVEVRVPEELMGDIMGDLNSRRGHVLGMETDEGTQVVRAKVPMAEMLDYENSMRSITGGRGAYTMDFSHYEEVPAHLAEKIIAQASKEKEEVAAH